MTAAAAAAAEGLKRFRHGDDDGASTSQRWLVCVDGSDKVSTAFRILLCVSVS